MQDYKALYPLIVPEEFAKFLIFTVMVGVFKGLSGKGEKGQRGDVQSNKANYSRFEKNFDAIAFKEDGTTQHEDLKWIKVCFMEGT